MPMARLSASAMPPPADTPMAMPSGMLWAMMAITNSQIRAAITGWRSVPTSASGEAPETLRSTRNRHRAPNITPKLIRPPAPQGLKPMDWAAPNPGMIRENAVAASITPAPKPSNVSANATGMLRMTSTGTAPSAVPSAHNAPPSRARSMRGSRSSQARPRATSSAAPASISKLPSARRNRRTLLTDITSERIPVRLTSGLRGNGVAPAPNQ
ncbi:hypothetical protein D3C75_946060 [compost metagenome]